VKTPADAAAMRAVGADAILMGEALMRAPDKPAALAAMRAATQI
jgi:indole-3-glycerol phosphate synthase